MSSPNLPVISHIVAADLPTLAQFLFASNLSQPTNQFLFTNWPNEPAQIALYTAGMEKSSNDPLIEMYKATDTTSGEIVASLILERSTPFVAAAPVPPLELAPPTGVNRAFHSMLRRMLADVQEGIKGVDHLVLSSIFVKPCSRKRGLGTQLVQLCIDKAKDAGVPLSLAAVPSAREFYKKLGFVVTAYAEVDLSAWAAEYAGFGIYRLCGMLMMD